MVLAGSAPAGEAFDKLAPESLEDLKQIQERVERVASEAASVTVSLDLGIDPKTGLHRGTGSGVVINPEGYILTAAHVIGEAGRLVRVIFPDGSIHTAVTLGVDQQSDAGLAKLEGQGPWLHAQMAEPDTLSPGDWVVALGHPGGFDPDRSVVVSLGRVVRVRPVAGIQSDCSLVGGDSGGPLFDMDGNVVGVHSRIGLTERTNIHVPIGEYLKGWQRLADGRQWGRRQIPILGIWMAPDQQDRGVLVERVILKSPASRAGLKPRDIITHINAQPILDERAVREVMALQLPGDHVELSVLRGGKPIRVQAELGELR